MAAGTGLAPYSALALANHLISQDQKMLCPSGKDSEMKVRKPEFESPTLSFMSCVAGKEFNIWRLVSLSTKSGR